jgi:alanyl-tRNA synthetase
MTERLYFDDPYRTDFEAKVLKRIEIDNRPALILDQTCFYPTAGGQECDRGVLNEVPVIDVIDHQATIVHVLKQEIVDDRIRGRIDWNRRFDFMQQHSGQHVLSQSFFRELKANTISSHLGEDMSTLEIARETLSVEEAHRVEDVANKILYENRAIKTYFVQEDEVGSIPLRRPPKKEGLLRIVEVEGFDHMGCGGTHCHRTGEIGLIKTGRWEKIRGHVRIQFLCGARALKECQWKNEAIEALSDMYSAKASDVFELVTKQMEECKSLRYEKNDLMKRVLDYEAKDLLAKAEPVGGMHVIQNVFDNRATEEMKTLALKIVGTSPAVVLFGTRGEKGQLVFCCSEGCPSKMNELMRKACDLIGGHGGGSPQLAFGGGPQVDKVEEAVHSIYTQVIESGTMHT